MQYTYNYAQPEEYKFSLDSVLLAKEVADRFVSHIQDADLKVLDLCAGCGVVGFDFNFHRPLVKNIDFLELQEAYLPFFNKNLEITQKRYQLVIDNYKNQIPSKNKYDLIISNPPYFKPGQGKYSPSEFKNRCRFFLDASFAEFLEFIISALDKAGAAYFLIRRLDEHGWDQFMEMHQMLNGRAKAQVIADVRGTDLIKLELCDHE